MSNLCLNDKVSFATILEDCFSEMNNKWDTSVRWNPRNFVG